MKEQSLDFEIARDFFIEMKSSVLSENIVSMFDFVILDIDLALSGLVYDYEITQHMRCVKSVSIRNYSGPYFPVFGPFSIQNAGKWGLE